MEIENLEIKQESTYFQDTLILDSDLDQSNDTS